MTETSRQVMRLLSTKLARRKATYAQKFTRAIKTHRLLCVARYQTHSDAKSLIHIALIFCFFLWQFSESLEFKGRQRREANLSTKLSTENLNICKALVNQALSALFACVGEAVEPNSLKRHTFLAAAP